jgi:Fe-S cluster assembly protein SufD
VPALSTPLISADAVRALPGPTWLQAERAASWARFTGAQMPTEAEEIWRYSRIDSLALDRYQPCLPGPALTLASLPETVRQLVETAGDDAHVLISHNGGSVEWAGPQGALTAIAGLTVEHAVGNLFPAPSADAGLGGPPPDAGLGGPPPDVWTDLNGALVGVPLRVSVAPGAHITGPVVIVHWLSAERGCVFPRLEVELGENASAHVIEVVASADIEVLAVPLTQLALARGARLGYAQVQLLGPRAWQLANQVSRVSRDADLGSMTVALGGDYARVRTDSVLLGAGAESRLLAAYFGTGSQMHDLRTVQHHAAPHCRSDLLFKGVVANHSQSVYSGLIRVEKGAKGTNAFQTNRNLVLSEGARAYSVPNLEIEDNDVHCSHASAVGPVDESQLFYLESRGVPTQTAERLVARGFLDDVLRRFPVEPMLGWLRQQISAKLDLAGYAAPQSR